MPFDEWLCIRSERLQVTIVKTNTIKILLGLLLITASCVRLYKIDSPLYDWNTWRQTETAAIAMNYYTDHLPFLYPEIDWVGEKGHAEMEFPLYAYLISCLYWLTSPWDTWGRIITLLFSVGTVYLLFDIGKQMVNPTMGLFAAAFFAVSPLGIYYGRTFMPDPMMVFFSTLSVSWLLRWDPKSKPYWLYWASAALSIGVLMKPPCLMVSLPLLWILYQKAGWKVMQRKSFWLCLAVIFVPAVLWYSHANRFFEETNASFMWHFKGVSFSEYLAMNWQWRNWNVIFFERISRNILAYVGLFPLAIGIIRLTLPHPQRMILVLWLLATFIYYAVIAAHHHGHDYYSLLPIVPLSLICAYGCEGLIRILPRYIHSIVGLIPAAQLIVGLIGLQQFGAYRQWYLYYQDAHAMQERIPEDALILVMDEILHTPEFFYFIDRNGWHRLRELYPQVSDAEWVEHHRSLGADYYFGMNEAPGNHPLHYLQTHPMGLYIRRHYEIEYIGARFFLANLNKPIDASVANNNVSTQVITAPAVMQAEDLLLGETSLITDPDADRGTALFAQSQEQAQVVTYGPYFYFPYGEYDITYRIRSHADDTENGVEIALSDSKTNFASKRLSTKSELKKTYQDFTLTAKITDEFPLEMRMVLQPHSSVYFDTVTIHHRKRFDSQTNIKHTITDLIAVDNQILQLTDRGILISSENENIQEITRENETVETIASQSEQGWLWINEDRVVFDQYHTPLVQLPVYEDGENAIAIYHHHDVILILTHNHVYQWQNGLIKTRIPQNTTPPRDLALNTDGEVVVLYGSGQLISLGSHQEAAGLPNFGADVCRRLIPHEEGFYVIDSLGAVHNTPNIPPVRSHYYKTEDWIMDAERTADGQWAFLTNEGKVLLFEE